MKAKKRKWENLKINISFLHDHCSLDVLHLEAPDEDVDKVDEGELDEGAEDGDEAEDDEDVHGCCIANLSINISQRALQRL